MTEQTAERQDEQQRQQQQMTARDREAQGGDQQAQSAKRISFSSLRDDGGVADAPLPCVGGGYGTTTGGRARGGSHGTPQRVVRTPPEGDSFRTSRRRAGGCRLWRSARISRPELVARQRPDERRQRRRGQRRRRLLDPRHQVIASRRCPAARLRCRHSPESSHGWSSESPPRAHPVERALCNRRV